MEDDLDFSDRLHDSFLALSPEKYISALVLDSSDKVFFSVPLDDILWLNLISLPSYRRRLPFFVLLYGAIILSFLGER